MCGPSEEQKQLAAKEDSFASMLQTNYGANFGAQSNILSQLTNIFTPIAEAGPDQTGWGPQETAAVNTQIGEGVAANYAKATQALNTSLAARGGGNEVLPTGSEAALKGGIATAAANQQSGEQLAATEANYAQGRQNFGNATSGLNALSQEYNPNAIAGQATTAQNAAFGQETKIQDMKNQEVADIAGGIVGLGMDAATFGAGAMGGAGFQGGLKALTGA